VPAQADVFHAIADPTRRRLLDRLAAGEHSVHRLAEPFAQRMSRPAVSQHLRVLSAAGLVTERKVGRERLYQLRPARLAEVAAWLQHYQRFWTQKLDALGAVLDAADTPPE
jgi:DNA-binding transcriptional ArsR family regulator